MKLIYCLFVSLSLFACSSLKKESHIELPVTKKEHLGQESAGVKLPISVHKPCSNNQCISYSYKIDGRILSKIMNKKSIQKKLTNQDVYELNAILINLKLKTMKSLILPGYGACGQYNAEGDTFLIRINKGLASQILKIYSGCHNLKSQHLALINWFENKNTHSSK